MLSHAHARCTFSYPRPFRYQAIQQPSLRRDLCGWRASLLHCPLAVTLSVFETSFSEILLTISCLGAVSTGGINHSFRDHRDSPFTNNNRGKGIEVCTVNSFKRLLFSPLIR